LGRTGRDGIASNGNSFGKQEAQETDADEADIGAEIGNGAFWGTAAEGVDMMCWTVLADGLPELAAVKASAVTAAIAAAAEDLFSGARWCF